MSIQNGYDEKLIIESIAKALDDFYTALIRKIDTLNINLVLRRKNPYLFRAKAMNSASEIVNSILAAFVSSSEETIFGSVFFEPIAATAVQGKKALAEGVDLMIEEDDTIYAIAVKSGTSVFNSSSKKKQEQNFAAAQKLAQQVKKRFIPIIGYGYGKKKSSKVGSPKIYTELAGQEFWAELTGDYTFYIKLIKFMDNLPEKYIDNFNQAYQRASNRLMKDFTSQFCMSDGSIDWEKLVRFNSGDLVLY